MADTPDTAESVQADALDTDQCTQCGHGYIPGCRGVDLAYRCRDCGRSVPRPKIITDYCVCGGADRYREALIEARNYIGTPRSSQSFAGDLLEILNRGLAR